MKKNRVDKSKRIVFEQQQQQQNIEKKTEMCVHVSIEQNWWKKSLNKKTVIRFSNKRQIVFFLRFFEMYLRNICRSSEKINLLY